MRNFNLRSTLSTLLISIFLIVLIFLGLFAEVFEVQTPEVDLAQIYANPVPVNELSDLKKFKLINKQGTFVFENTDPQFNLAGPWQMTEPQSLKLKNDVVVKIIDALKVIRVRNFYRLEPINISSFSLDNPTMTLLFTNSMDKVIEIKMGLINPIDNSAYLSLSGQDQIYQIDPIEMALESYDLPQLAQSKILAINDKSLVALEIFGKEGALLKILKKENQWVDQEGQILSETKLSRLFENLEKIEGQAILENLAKEQKDYLSQTLSVPLYGLKLISEQGTTRTYIFGIIEGQVPNLQTATQGKVILSSDDKESFTILDQSVLKILKIKNNELK
jgi:Domain of unknown function (DUF4340)